ncbi:hypothetical protein QVD17_27986 [Tagetes erecta]|uniref:Aspartyl/Glutamyl-tRNA(Gln) amidotransferase subunit B/E catalytic domain-containing protein n=1 Tax=Tagetes erecta TaxID=13708 RepID=A0AAD8K9K8_TARER|nr:hypothetical protein QVD17_27986 [Tagetes erecta]
MGSLTLIFHLSLVEDIEDLKGSYGGGCREVVSYGKRELFVGVEAAEYAAELQRVVRYLGVSNGKMQQGSLHCDVNVSIRPICQLEFGTKTEFYNQGQADEVVQETRLWEEGAQKTVTMRKKEGFADYRYFPEPDLSEVELTEVYVNSIRDSLPELLEMKHRRYEDMGLTMKDVLFLANDVIIVDPAEIEKIVDKVIANNPNQLEQYRGGVKPSCEVSLQDSRYPFSSTATWCVGSNIHKSPNQSSTSNPNFI